MHPSYLLRLQDDASKKEGFRAFVEDLKRIRTAAENDNRRIPPAGQARIS